MDLGLECTAFRDPRLEKTLQGIKRDHNQPEPNPRTPLTRPYLLLMINTLSDVNHDDVVIRAAFTLAFAAFLRVCEFTYRKTDLKLDPTFRNWFLSKSSINWIEGVAHMELTLPASKTDPFRHGIQVLIAASKEPGCTVAAIRRLAEIDGHRARFVPLSVGRESQHPFTREYVG